MSKEYLNIKVFNTDTSEHTGGVTGSAKVQTNDDISYQLKPSIKDAKFFRKLKAGGVDRENYGEVIASIVSRALTGSDKEGATELVPKVVLVYDEDKKRTLVASRYLDNVEGGTIDDYAKKKRGVETEKRHVQVDAQGLGASGVLGIGGKDDESLRKDLAKALAVSILSGDHDVNPGNMVVMKDKEGKTRIARIDFGHAFNDLLNAPKMFGGKVRNKDNQVLDFLNRETLSDLVPAKRQPKLWRDYKGMVPSSELAEAFKEMANSKSAQEGIAAAKKTFQDLVTDLSADPIGNKEVLDHIKSSLATINNNVSDNKINLKKLTAQEVLDQTFKNLGDFYSKGQEQMKDVAKLVDMQVKIDKLILDKKEGKSVDPALVSEIKGIYTELEKCKGIGIKGKAIEWVKNDKDSKAFKGSLDEFIKKRSKDLGLDKVVTKDLAHKDFAIPTKPGIMQRFRTALFGDKESEAQQTRSRANSVANITPERKPQAKENKIDTQILSQVREIKENLRERSNSTPPPIANSNSMTRTRAKSEIIR